MKSVRVLKFGGTSVGSPEAIKSVVSVIKKSPRDGKIAAVVVSAMSGVTDELQNIAALAATQDPASAELLARIKTRHLNTIKVLVSRKNRQRAVSRLTELFGRLEESVTGIRLVRELSPGAADHILSYGEQLSACMLTEILLDRKISAEYLDARTIIRTDNTFGGATVDFSTTNRLIRNYFKQHKPIRIVTGFIGTTAEGKTTTLGRGGSDYTASILGAALEAKRIEIWTDVSGVMTADPRKVKNARPIAVMSYREAVEMSYFGAKVIHPPTIRPAEVKNIPLLIKNTFEPEHPGTYISKKTHNDTVVKGITSISNVAMLQVEGSGLPRIRGASGRIFGALAQSRVNVILITQASSQQSVSFAVSLADAEKARVAIEEEFSLERARKLINPVSIQKDLSIIAVVGEGMRHHAGIAGRLFGMLGDNSINVVAIAQGSSELNISVVIEKTDELIALNAVHMGFFFPKTRLLNIFLVGTGLIGGALLRQIATQKENLEREYGYIINVRGVADEHKMVLAPDIDPKKWRSLLRASRVRTDVKRFVETAAQTEAPGKVFVDCTASEKIAGLYADLLSAGVSVVTPNKRANTGTLAYHAELQELARRPGVSYYYETTAGAALPVISILRDLLLSGDKVVKIEAVLSGTLTYIFNSFTGKISFSETVAKAKKLGLTEPDPREDLSGVDVARKILILARESRIPLELKDIKVESLLPKNARDARTLDRFFRELKKQDATFEKKKQAAEKKGMRLRYIATLDEKKASVSLQAVPPEHPFFQLSGSDNIIAFTTKRYNKTPLIVKGPGAGAEVTAAGVFADILRSARDTT